jgi:hypothetical protein
VARITIHSANANFWNDYRALPISIRARADKQFSLLKNNPRHPSLQFQKARRPRRAGNLVGAGDEYVWFWVGERNVYNATIS